MARAKRVANARPPAGWDALQPTLTELAARMRAAETAPPGRSATQRILRVHRDRSRYIFDLLHTRRAISRKLFDYCVARGLCDPALAAFWRRRGFERLCCVRCAARDSAFGTVCVCRVPRAKTNVEDDVAANDDDDNKNTNTENDSADAVPPCANCGCRGCASGG